MSTQERRKQIEDYYKESQVIYDLFWTDRRTSSMNYGFWMDGTRSLSEAFVNQNRAIAQMLNIGATDTVLEAGCGTGGTSIWLAKHCGARVVGITLSEGQATRAKHIATESGVAKLTSFCVMDYLRMGFPASSFTKVFASESICYSEAAKDFLAEAYRSLMPRGQILIVDGFRSARRLNDRQERIYSDWREGWALPRLSTVESFCASLESVGFKNVRFSDETRRIQPSSERLYLLGILGYPIVRMLGLLGISSRVQIGHVLASVRQYEMWTGGIGVYGTVWAEK